jgi:hypothetical protein
MNKPRRYPRPLAEFVSLCLADTFAQRGFAATEIVTHWEDIVGPEVAAHAEPMKIQWPRPTARDTESATLLLRVEGPAAIEIQHLAGVIIDRVNRFFGWQAIGRIALRQAPLARRKRRRALPAPDPALAEAISRSLTGISDRDLRAALGRLGAAIKGK